MESDQELNRLSALTTLGNKLDHLYEIITVLKGKKINETYLPIMNLYQAFLKRPFSILRFINTLIKQLVRVVKEYIQASKFDQFPIQATSREQFVTFQIPLDSPHQWMIQDYIHIHFDAIRLTLSYYGKKGLPVAVISPSLIPDI